MPQRKPARARAEYERWAIKKQNGKLTTNFCEPFTYLSQQLAQEHVKDPGERVVRVRVMVEEVEE